MHEVHKNFPIDLQVQDNAVNIIKYLGQRILKLFLYQKELPAKKIQKILVNYGSMESIATY